MLRYLLFFIFILLAFYIIALLSYDSAVEYTYLSQVFSWIDSAYDSIIVRYENNVALVEQDTFFFSILCGYLLDIAINRAHIVAFLLYLLEMLDYPLFTYIIYTNILYIFFIGTYNIDLTMSSSILESFFSDINSLQYFPILLEHYILDELYTEKLLLMFFENVFNE